MSRIVIRRRVTLDFLGEPYKEAYLDFKQLPFKSFADFRRGIASVEDDMPPQPSEDAPEAEVKAYEKAQIEAEAKSLEYMLKVLEDNFLGGKFPGQDGELFDVQAEELGEFDGQTVIKCFQNYTGQNLDETDPKE